MLELQAHRSNPSKDYKVFASYEVGAKSVVVDFEVESADLNFSEEFNLTNWDNWNLWEHDVVEVFIQKKSDQNHYLELQVSPRGQKFALLIKKPRKEFDKIINLETDAQAIKTEKGFRAQFNIDISDIPGEGDDIYGNLHACLGPGDSRHYYSFKLNPETTADFHRPDLFDFLGTVNE